MNSHLSLRRLFLGGLLAVIGMGWLSMWPLALPTVALSTVALPTVVLPTAAALDPSACTFLSEPQRYNTQTRDNVIVIGAQPNRRYRTVIVGDDAETLTGLRTCVIDAFAAQSRLGPYIQVGSFERRAEAEQLRRRLRRAGYRPRVVYGRL
jgi:hypothetical protein